MEPVRPDELTASGVSWAAVIGGAFVAAAMALILLSLGHRARTLLRLALGEQWRASPAAIGAAAIVWLIVAQILAFGFGGYVAGRPVRTVGDGPQRRGVLPRHRAWGCWCGPLPRSSRQASSRPQPPTWLALDAGALTPGVRVARRWALKRPGPPNMRSMGCSGPRGQRRNVPIPRCAPRWGGSSRTPCGAGRWAQPTRLTWIAWSRHGPELSQSDADQRVTQVFSDLQAAIDVARRQAAKLSLWVFIALLTGAFCASLAATIWRPPAGPRPAHSDTPYLTAAHYDGVITRSILLLLLGVPLPIIDPDRETVQPLVGRGG